MQVEQIRAALHEAIDRVLDGSLEAEAATPSKPDAAPTGDSIDIRKAGEQPPFPHTWPDGNDEEFSNARSYTVVDQGREHRAVVGWTDREAWGRMRRRAVVFGVSGRSRYPWTEFVETDDGRYAAEIPDPDHPRAVLKEGAPVPDWFATAAIERTDQLFRGTRKGPSLRLVLGPDDEVRMVRHGYWVAGLRKRI
jgi:hypothetical protein